MSDNPLILQYSDGNLVPYQTPDPAQAAQRALDFTGIPDLASGVNALARGEWLPGLGQAASGAAGLLPLGKLAGAAKLGAELMPLGGLIKAWHGTPHLFEPVEHNPFGEFRDAAIGTGEGAQAYGHGHYVAGNPAVAEDYQRGLAGSRPTFANESGDPLSSIEVARKFYEPGTVVPSYGGDFDKIIRFNEHPDFNWSVDVQRVVPSEGAQAYKNLGQLLQNPDAWKPHPFERPKNHSTFPSDKDIEDIGNIRGIPMTQPGSLLEVHILPDEHELLDWDKPLGEQPSGVRKVIDQIHAGNEDLRIKHSGPDVTGENFYRNLANQMWDKTLAGIGGGSEAASKALHEAGIPGIKYLDQGSRGKIADVYHNGELHEGGLDMGFYSPKDVALSSLLGRGRYTIGGDPAPDIDATIESLRKEASPGSMAGFGDKKNAEIFGNAADWLHRERGNIEIRPPSQTSNYVIFDPKNLRIVGRNGQRLEPVDEDPFK